MSTEPDEAMERAVRARAKSRQAFIVALRCRKELRRAASDPVRALEFLCLVDSLECGLKAFALFEAGRAPRGHDLSSLLRALSPGVQSQLVARTGEPAERFDTNLGVIQGARRDARHDLRSVDAGGSSLKAADLRFLRTFARAVQKQLHGHAPAAPKSVAGPTREPSGDDPMSGKRPSNLSCSFCGKGQQEVRKLIAGPTVYICDECIRLCNDIIAEEIAGEAPRVGAVAAHGKAIVALARRFAEACGNEVELPRPVAERARALAEEIEVVIAAQADARVVLGEYAKSVAAMARHFAKACDAVELPRGVAERARSLFVEIEALVGPSDQD